MRIVVIDPHITKPYSYAVFEDNAFVASGHSTLSELHRTLGNEIDLVIIETQYFSKNLKTMAGLATSKGMVLGWCVTHDILWVEVYPVQWQSYMKYNKKTSETKEEAITKKKDVRVALTHIYGEADEHIQDCIMMYKWWVNEQEKANEN